MMVYRCPGAHFGPNGTTYDAIGVNDDAEFKEAKRDGWHDSLVVAAYVYLSEYEDQQNDDGAEENQFEAAPTRAELEHKAGELGIKFDGRTTDRKLLEKIDEALRG